MPRLTHTLLAGVLASIAWVGVPHRAHADEGATACLGAHEGGQRQRAAGQLLEARESMLECADPSCPTVLREECVQWLEELTADLPSIVLAARDPSGKDLVDVEVFCDDAKCASSLDGKAIDVDPGPHRIRFVDRGHSPPVEAVVEVVIRQGDKLRAVEVVLGAAPPPAPRPAKPPPVRWERPMPPLVPVLAGLGVVGLGVAGVSFATARADESDLGDAGCAPRCSIDASETVDRGDTVAAVAGLAGVALVGASVVLYLARPAVRVVASPSGAGASVVGRF